MNYDDFYGLDEQVRRLRADFASSGGVHAYLFTGPAGTGKRSMAELCSRAVHCTGEIKPCDACPACKRHLFGTHPDHIALSPVKKSIGVEEVRDLIARVSIKPFEGVAHTVVIDRADKMTAQAQNALLKTLEEPPGNAVFFLLAEQAEAMLTTIVSRCRAVRFHAIAYELTARALIQRGVAAERAPLLAAVAQGSVGRALELNESEEYWALRLRAVGALEALKGPGDVARAFALVKQDKDQVPALMDAMELCASDLLRIEAGLDPAQADIAGRLRRLSFAGDKLAQGVMRARQMLNSNVSFQTALEMLFFDLVGG